MVPIWGALLLAGGLARGAAVASEPTVSVVKRAGLPSHCREIGRFKGDAGHGKHADGKRVALSRAKRRAASAGATHAVVLHLSRGHSDMGGYCKLAGYHCPPTHR